MGERVMVRQSLSLRGVWEVLCPCCAYRKPGVAVLRATDSWRHAVDIACTHVGAHR